MTTNTPYLNLILYNSTTDQSASFATFRADIAGVAASSNFYKIDTAYNGLNTRITTLETAKSAILTNATFISSNFYEATVSGITAYNTGMSIALKLDTDSAGTVTLDINSLGTKSVMKVDSTGSVINMSAGELQAGRYYLFIYDGTRWVWVDASSADQVYHSGTVGNVVLVASDSSLNDSVTPNQLVTDTIIAAGAKTTPVGADTFPMIDSEDSSSLKEITWANIIAAIPSAPSNRSWFGV